MWRTPTARVKSYDSRDNFGNLMKKAQRNNYEPVSMPTISEKLPDIDEEEIKEDKKRVAEFIEKNAVENELKES